MLQLPNIPQEERFWVTLERGWRNDLIDFVGKDLPHILFVILAAFIVQHFVLLVVRRMNTLASRNTDHPQRASQLRTTASILRATSYAILSAIVLLHILARVGFNLTPLLASAGIVGVGIGLGAQSLFKDIINGLFILFEDQYNVGETIKAAGLSGTVENITLRTTWLRDADGTLHIVPNSQIATVSNQSRDYAVATLPLSVDSYADPARVLALLRDITAQLAADPAFASKLLATPDVPGIDRLHGSEAVYPINLRVCVNQKDAILRELRLRVLDAFHRERIPLSSNTSTLVLHQKIDPTAPPTQQPLIG